MKTISLPTRLFGERIHRRLWLFLLSTVPVFGFAAATPHITVITATGGDTVRTGVSRNELLPAYMLDTVKIHGRTLTDDERHAYLRMVYNIRKTYPYAVLAKERMDRYNALRRESDSKKEMRRFLKEEEARIKADFMEDLKNMTRSQGAILLKLLARQTDTTAYFLLKDFRGGAKAAAYQTIARFWGYNLKDNYDPDGKDSDIEIIVKLIEQGRILPITPKVKPAIAPQARPSKRKKDGNRTPQKR